MALNLPAGLIDIHCHMLHGVDDGPATIGMALHMCGVAQAAGTVAVVTTPHCSHRFAFDPRRTADLCARLQEQTPHALRLFPGCELEVSLETLPAALRDLSGYTLNGSRYLLLELMAGGMPANLDRVFARLLEEGVVPVVAHPERSARLQTQPGRLAAWVERGCLVQITADSLSGRRGARLQAASFELLQRRLVHFVASDGHDPFRRPPRLLDAYQAVRRSVSPAVAQLLFVSNPLAVLQNQPIRAWPAF
jgi:protein-tyrosine phosphatase